MQPIPRPHDLLWGMTPDQLPADAPAWAVKVLAAGLPVVVRRAPARPGLIPVGLRGARRNQRLACWVHSRVVVCRLSPEAILLPVAAGDSPALQALLAIRGPLDQLGLPWGVTGGVAYQLATGCCVLHADSDLDLLVRAEQPFDRASAARLLARLELLPCRADVQLETPDGAIALREWAGGARQLLLKSNRGPRLVSDPWGRTAA